MSVITSDLNPWSRGRWALTILFAAAVQAGLIFTLSSRTSIKPRTPVVSPQVILPVHLPERLKELTDPTLLALGSAHDFASIWMQPPPLPPVKSDWSAPERWLDMDPAHLGSAFRSFARSNLASLHGLVFKPPPQSRASEPKPVFLPLREHSTVQLSPGLNGRKLLNQPNLPSIEASDILKPSEVQVVLDAFGNVVSAALLENSGSREADQIAIRQAIGSVFTPLVPNTNRDALTLGKIVFSWHTLPPGQTNAPTASPAVSTTPGRVGNVE